jgi:hypothetical protein
MEKAMACTCAMTAIKRMVMDAPKNVLLRRTSNALVDTRTQKITVVMLRLK